MAINIYLTNYSKPENSTAHPATSDMNQFTGVLKSDCSVESPVILLDLSSFTDTSPARFNYAYISKFSRWYWVSEARYVRGLWEFTLTVDVLASFKSDIGNSTLYVLRAASDYDGDIIDNLYPTKTGAYFSVNQHSNKWRVTGNGFYVIGVVSRDGQWGSITYYALTAGNMATLIQNLLNDSIITANGFSVDDASLQLQKSIIDPLNYIKSCVYIPLSINSISGTAVSQLPIFDYNINCIATIPSSIEAHLTETFTRPTHPDTNSRGNYVNSSPYTILTLAIPPFGIIELDTSVTCNAGNVVAEIMVDLATGEGTLEVIAGGDAQGDPVLINSVKSQVGVPIQLSQITRNYLGAAGSILGSVGSAFAGNVLGTAAGVGNAIQSLAPRANTIGSSGAFSSLWSYVGWELIAQFFRPVADDNTHHGRPLCKNKKINTLSGYVIVQDGDIGVSYATLEENQKVKEYLETGFYYD